VDARRLSLGLECTLDRSLWYVRLRALHPAPPGAWPRALDGQARAARARAAQYADASRDGAARLAVDAAWWRAVRLKISDVDILFSGALSHYNAMLV